MKIDTKEIVKIIKEHPLITLYIVGVGMVATAGTLMAGSVLTGLMITGIALIILTFVLAIESGT